MTFSKYKIYLYFYVKLLCITCTLRGTLKHLFLHVVKLTKEPIMREISPQTSRSHNFNDGDDPEFHPNSDDGNQAI